ncbi:hypothetical protein OG500_00625 [Kitasatospora sp. NBC_01250]|uniref:hypothetical protein n=1 Tax=unclassified Kitasatospora TaxID=2633591 RepID=UPI002E0D242C|nr:MULTISPECIES: hypothetical protein [unclassified Kitasatospora]WSJ64701.1 hypothetical protein OG294_00530 [Kitasatospora sp. NBC_01302]
MKMRDAFERVRVAQQGAHPFGPVRRTADEVVDLTVLLTGLLPRATAALKGSPRAVVLSPDARRIFGLA